MGDENEVPLLLEFLFGEAAGTAQRGASARLLRWAEAFDQWLAERALKVTQSTARKSKNPLRRLLQERRPEVGAPGRGLMPWQLTQADIEAHAAWMKAQEYAPSTISYELGILENFYRWCDERGVDPECEAGYNPAAGVKRPRVKRFANVQLLSRGEVDALLGILAKDETPLGKRDYAFFLARLRVGVKLQELVQLRWGQLELDAEGARVLWEPGERRARLPGEVWEVPQWELRDKLGTGWGKMPREVWEAIRAYLAASGRLAGMRDKDYIFAPLAQTEVAVRNDREEDWEGGRSLSGRQIRRNLKLYGRLVGIAEEKLNLEALRCTAIRLRLDQGASKAELKEFLHSRDARFEPLILEGLPGLPENGERAPIEAQAPDRAAKPFQPGDGLTHGFTAQRMPEEEVQAVLAEDIHGIKEEIAGLDWLLRDLESRMREPMSLREELGMLDAHTRTAFRLTDLLADAEQFQQEEEPDPEVEDFLEMIERIGIEGGEPGCGEQARQELYASEPELDLRARQIASIRCSLRRVLKMTSGAKQVSEYLHLVDIYGRGVSRLVRMLKVEGTVHSRAKRRIREAIRLAVLDVNKEWGLVP